MSRSVVWQRLGGACLIVVVAACGGGAGTRTQSDPPALTPTAAAAATSTIPAPAGGLADVLTYRGDVSRSGAMPGPGPGADPEVLWAFKAGAPIGSQAVVADGVVYVASNDGTLHAIDPSTGAERWHVALGAPSLGGMSLSGGLAVVATDSGLVAVSLERHEVAWQAPDAGTLRGTPAIVDGMVFAGSTAGLATATDLATGASRWSRAVGDNLDTSVAVSDGLVVFGAEDGVVLALNPTDGSTAWRFDTGDGARIGTPTIVDGTVYVVSLGSGSHHLLALALHDGSLRWRVASPDPAPMYSPTIVGDAAISGDETGAVVAFDTRTGTIDWRADVPGLIEVVMSSSGGSVYAATNGNSAFAIDAATGMVRWQVAISGVPYAVAITGGMVLVGTSVGSLYAIGNRP
jgi:outer membrane protein assembly factor BamB